MKTSNILIVLLGTFLLSATAYDKVKLVKEYKKIDQSIQFGDHNNVIPIQYSHVKVTGGNFDGRVELHQRPKSEMRFKDNIRGRFSHQVKNDTLYINFKKKFTNTFAKDWSKNRLILIYDSIQSFSFTNSQNYVYCKKLKHLNIIGNGVNASHIHLEHVDSLSIKAFDNTRIKSAPCKTHHLKIRAKDDSNIALQIFTNSENEIVKSENAIVKIN